MTTTDAKRVLCGRARTRATFGKNYEALHECRGLVRWYKYGQTETPRCQAHALR